MKRRVFLAGGVGLAAFGGYSPASPQDAPGGPTAELRPEQFGAGNGDDDTAALRAFLDRLADGTTGVLAGTYQISSELRLRGKRKFTLRGPGTITMKPGVPSRWGFGGLRLTDCSDFVLSGFTIDGNRSRREPRELPAHNFIFESCHRFRCEGLQSLNGVVDGFLFYTESPARLQTHCSDFAMMECVAENNWRQGCSVVHGRRGQFIGGRYGGTNGTAPMAGIDLEADQGSPLHSVEDILLSNVRFEANQGYGLLVSSVSTPRAVRVIDCTFVDNKLGAISWGAETGEITRPTIEGFGPWAFRGAIDIPVGPGGNLAIVSPIFRRTTADGEGQPLIYIHEGSAGNVTVQRLSANGCAAIAAFWAPRCSLTDSEIVSRRANFSGAILIFGDGCVVARNTISEFYGAVIYADAQDVTVSANRLSNPRQNDETGCINARGRVVVIDNVVTASGGITAIATQGAATARGNRISGFRTQVRRI
jgi:hypothetical protein